MISMIEKKKRIRKYQWKYDYEYEIINMSILWVKEKDYEWENYEWDNYEYNMSGIWVEYG